MIKQFTLTAILGLISMAGFSQYKKASFFNKSGRVHEFCAGTAHMGSTGGGITPYVYYAAAMETEKKLSIVSEFGMQFKSAFSYTGEYQNTGGAPVTETFKGKTPLNFMIKYGVRYRFISSEGEQDNQVVPYVKLSYAAMFTFSDKITLTRANGESISPQDASPQPVSDAGSMGLEGAAGCYYYFSSKFGVKAELGYFQYVNAGKIFGDYSSDEFNPIKSFPTLSIGLKIKISGE